MSEEKAVCSNPECGNDDVSDKVKNYSLDNYGVILCYPCQELVRSGKLDVEALKETLKKKGTLEEDKKEEENKGTLDSFGGGAKESEEELGEYDREVAAELEAELKELDAKIIETVTAMSVPDESKFHAWLESEYGVKRIDDLALQDKRKVLEETKRLADKMGDGKVIDAEVVKEEGPEWKKTVEIDEGTFAFHEEDGKLLCKSGDNVYELHVSVPDCTCPAFLINKEKNKWCKHLKAASQLYRVKEFPKVPAEVEKALAKPEKEKMRRAKAKKEEVMALTIMDKQVELSVQVPTELILSEEKAVETIKAIVGPNPKKEDIIMSYANIEELNASVITSLAQYIGIRYVPIMIEEEKQRMNMGEIYLAGASRDQKVKYEAVAKLMGPVDITTRCKITTLSGWRDNSGNVRIGIGTKEEILLPHDLLDISRRGAAYIRTKCETKSAKKSIINALPVTAEGILRKVKQVYGWE